MSSMNIACTKGLPLIVTRYVLRVCVSRSLLVRKIGIKGRLKKSRWITRHACHFIHECADMHAVSMLVHAPMHAHIHVIIINSLHLHVLTVHIMCSVAVYTNQFTFNSATITVLTFDSIIIKVMIKHNFVQFRVPRDRLMTMSCTWMVLRNDSTYTQYTWMTCCNRCISTYE